MRNATKYIIYRIDGAEEASLCSSDLLWWLILMIYSLKLELVIFFCNKRSLIWPPHRLTVSQRSKWTHAWSHAGYPPSQCPSFVANSSLVIFSYNGRSLNFRLHSNAILHCDEVHEWSWKQSRGECSLSQCVSIVATSLYDPFSQARISDLFPQQKITIPREKSLFRICRERSRFRAHQKRSLIRDDRKRSLVRAYQIRSLFRTYKKRSLIRACGSCRMHVSGPSSLFKCHHHAVCRVTTCTTSVYTMCNSSDVGIID